MKISLIYNLNKAEVIDVNFENLQGIILGHEWSPSVFSGTRRKSNFLQTDLIVLDVDSGPTIEEACNQFKKYRYIIAPTRNHRVEKNGKVCDRYRVVLFLQSTISNNSIFDSTWRKLYNKYKFIDKACKDSSRFFYPSTSIFSTNEGKLIEPEEPQEIKYDNTVKDYRGFFPVTYKYIKSFGIPEGQRNHTIFKVSCDLYRFGYTPDEVYNLILEVTDLPEHEILNTTKSAAQAVLK